MKDPRTLAVARDSHPEIWKPVIGYEGVYEVSDLGRVRRVSGALKITADDLAVIRDMRTSGKTLVVIGERFGVSKTAVRIALNYPQSARTLRTNNRVLAPVLSTHGYVTVKLCRDGKAKGFSIHSLVARAFLGPYPEGYEVNHKNGIRNDPRLVNLEYVTRPGNAIHSHRILGVPGTSNPGLGNGCAKVTEADVLAIRALYKPGYGETSKLAKQFGVTKHLISRIVLRKTWRHI